MIYLDHATTAQGGDLATAPHRLSQSQLPAMERAYAQLHQLVGARESDTVLFTSSGAEGVNHALWSAYMEMGRESGRNHYVAGVADEAPALLALERLTQFGCEMTLAPLNDRGVVTVEAVAESLQPRTGMVSLSWANGLTGCIHQVVEIAELCRDRGVWFHLDATHVLGKIPFDLDEIAPDFLSFNGDHIGGPVGTGGLFIRSGIQPAPLIMGGSDQAGLRGGSVSLPLLQALGDAAEAAHAGRDTYPMEGARLKARLLAGLEGGELLFQGGLPHVACITFPGVVSDALLYRLSLRGLYASFGGGNAQQLALQLVAAGISQDRADCSLSFSFGLEEETIDRAIALINEEVAALQKLSEGIWADRV